MTGRSSATGHAGLAAARRPRYLDYVLGADPARVRFDALLSEEGGRFFDALRTDMVRNYDYALIDSRTGVSDVAAVCTIHLPDILVACFTMSEHSIEIAPYTKAHQAGVVAVILPIQQQEFEIPITLDDVLAVVTDASEPALDAIVDNAFAGKPGEVEAAFGKALTAGVYPGAIISAAQRQAAQLHRVRIGMDKGGGPMDAMATGFPRLHF